MSGKTRLPEPVFQAALSLISHSPRPRPQIRPQPQPSGAWSRNVRPSPDEAVPERLQRTNGRSRTKTVPRNRPKPVAQDIGDAQRKKHEGNHMSSDNRRAAKGTVPFFRPTRRSGCPAVKIGTVPRRRAGQSSQSVGNRREIPHPTLWEPRCVCCRTALFACGSLPSVNQWTMLPVSTARGPLRVKPPRVSTRLLTEPT